MDSARPHALRSFVVLGVTFLVGYLVANPAGSVWRARYWVGLGDRAMSLDKLVEVEPVGAESEIDHALESDDEGLQYTAASALARRGDKRGIETLVRLCGEGRADDTPARRMLESLLENPSQIDRFDSVKEWFESSRHLLKCQQHAMWVERAMH